MMNNQASDASGWAPLRQPIFRVLWIAGLFSNVGMWMRDVAGAWLMTSLSPSPIMVALMQTAGSLPIFLLGLPAGALADVVDRRRLLLFCQVWMMAGATLLGTLTVLGLTTPWALLILSFGLQVGGAMALPVYQAIVPELVNRDDVRAAVTLGAVGFNLSRAVGPALGGLVVAALGPGAVFLLSAASLVGVVTAIYRWHRAVPESALPTERVLGAIRTGMRYMLHAPELHALFLRTFLFTTCASALWALLPLLARRQLGLDSLGYGVLLGCLGAGAVLAAIVLPKMRQRFSVDVLVTSAQLLFAMVLVGLAFIDSVVLVGFSMALGGVAWVSLLSTFNGGVQVAVPSWVRGRAMAAFGMIFFAGMAGGSVVWGAVASFAGIPAALVSAGLGLASILAFTARYRLPNSEGLDLAPSMHWPERDQPIETRPEQGPILVTIEYRIDARSSREFARAMQGMRRIRLRDGAIEWGLFHDTTDLSRYVEFFIVESWLDHLRQHERFTVADRATAKLVQSFHVGETPPIVSHMTYAYGSEQEP
jgi:MFS family permease